MYIIHCCVRNNTWIIPAPWTFVNGVFPQNPLSLTSLYISHRIRLFVRVELVILPNAGSNPPCQPLFPVVSVPKKGFNPRFSSYSLLNKVSAPVYPAAFREFPVPGLGIIHLSNRIYALSVSLFPFRFSSLLPRSMCKMPWTTPRHPFRCINIRIFYIRNASRSREAFMAGSIKNPYCCFPGCSRPRSRSSGRLPPHRSCTGRWWAPG